MTGFFFCQIIDFCLLESFTKSWYKIIKVIQPKLAPLSCDSKNQSVPSISKDVLDLGGNEMGRKMGRLICCPAQLVVKVGPLRNYAKHWNWPKQQPLKIRGHQGLASRLFQCQFLLLPERLTRWCS